LGLPNEINVGRIGRLLQRLLQIKGSSPAPQLTPEILAILGLEMDRPEWGFLTGELRFAQQRDQPATAGLFSTCRLRNPAGSGVIAVVQSIIASTNQAAAVTLNTHTTDASLGNEIPVAPIDTRWGTMTSGLLFSRGAVAAAVGQEFHKELLNVASGGQVRYFTPVILKAGSAIDVTEDVVLTRLIVSFAGYQRPVEASEL